MNTEGLKKTTNLKQLSKTLVLTGLLLLCGITAKAQSVIMSGGYYLKHGQDGHSVEATSSTGFDPRTCLWYLNNNTIKTANSNGVAFTGNYFLQNGSISLGNSSTWSTAQNGSNLRSTGNNYLRRRGNGAWQLSTNTNNLATAYAATYLFYK